MVLEYIKMMTFINNKALRFLIFWYNDEWQHSGNSSSESQWKLCNRNIN